MGNKHSRNNESAQAHNTDNSSISHVNSDSTVDSYESALQSDPSLRSFNTNLRDRTTRAINSVANSPSLSLDSLCHVTSSLADINGQVVTYILQSKEEIWRNPELLDLVNEYFESSSKTLSFYSGLTRCLKKTRISHIYIQLAIERFNEEKSKLDEELLFPETLRELDKFKAVGDPFAGDFIRIFMSIYDSQASLQSKLEAKKKKLDNKLGRLKGYRIVSNVLFGAAFAVVMICSVVAAAVVAPPVAAALLVAAENSQLGAARKWMSLMLKGFEIGAKNKRILVQNMERRTLVAVYELKTIESSVEHLRVEIEAMLVTAGIPVKQDDVAAVTLVIEVLEKNLGGLIKTVDNLETNSVKYRNDIERARSLTLDNIRAFSMIS